MEVESSIHTNTTEVKRNKTWKLPQILNDHFEVAFYNGGAQGDEETKWGIQQALISLKHSQAHSCKSSKVCDLVLKWKDNQNSDRFTLTHLFARGGVACTKPLKEALVWIHDTMPDVSSFESFNDFTFEKFLSYSKTGDKDPIAYINTKNDLDLDFFDWSTELPECPKGKYVHFKMLRNHNKGNGSNLFDLTYLGIIGYPKEKDGRSYPTFPNALASLGIGVFDTIDLRIPNAAQEYFFKFPAGKVLRTLKAQKLCFIHDMCVNKERLFSAMDDRTIRVWGTKSGVEERELSGHTGAVYAIDIAYGKMASASGDKTVKIWDKIDNTAQIVNIATLAGHDETVNGVRFIDNERVVSSSLDGSLRVWNIATGECIKIIRPESKVNFRAAAVSKKIIAGCGDKCIYLYDSQSYEHLGTLTGHSAATWAAVFSHDESILYTSSEDKTIKLWSMKTMECVDTYTGHEGPIKTLCINETFLFSGSNDRSIRVWDLITGECLSVLRFHEGFLKSVAFGDGYLFSSVGAIAQWSFDEQPPTSVLPHPENPTTIQLFDNYLLSGSVDGLTRVWNLETHECIRILEGTTQVKCISVFQNNVYIVYQDVLRIFNMKTWECEKTLKSLHEGAVSYVIGLGDYMFTGGTDNLIKYWNVKAVDCLYEMKGHEGSITRLLLHPDGNTLYSASEDATIRIWKWNATHDNFTVDTLKGHVGHVNGLALSPDGKLLYSAGADKNVRVWDLEKLENIKSWVASRGNLKDVLVSNDRIFTFAMLGADKGISMWDRETGNLVKVLKGHTLGIFCCIGNSEYLYSSSGDKTVRIWNLQLLMARKEWLRLHTPRLVMKMVEEKGNEKALEILKAEDCFHRNLIMLLCAYGSPQLLKTVQYLVEEYDMRINKANVYGEDGVYFAVRGKRWLFLKAASLATSQQLTDSKEIDALHASGEGRKKPIKKQVTVGKRTKQYLVLRAQMDDVEFFTEFFKSGVKYSGLESELFASAFLSPYSEQKVLYLWKDNSKVDINIQDPSNGWTLLHYASYYGCPNVTELLLQDRRIRVDVIDKNMNSALNIAMLNDHPPLQVTLGMTQRKDHQIDMDRMECARKLLDVQEASRKSKLFTRNTKGSSTYEMILMKHDEYRNKMKVEKKEMQQYQEIKNQQEGFSKSLDVLDLCTQRSDVRKFRRRFAMSFFGQTTVPYVLWLILLLFVSFGHNRNTQQAFYFSESIKDQFIDSGFEDVEDAGDIYDWLQNSLIDALELQQTNEEQDPRENIFMEGHHLLLGAISLRQLRTQSTTCTIPSGFGDDFFGMCTPTSFIESKDTFGPTSAFEWNQNSDGSSFRDLFGKFYPQGGYIVEFTPETNMTELIESLESNNWIDSNTRSISITFTIYNANLNYFSSVLLHFEFLAAGKIVPVEEVITVRAARYLTAFDYFLLALDIIIALYFIREFPAREIYEVWKNRAKYIFEIWNYYEWTLIVLFVAIVALRIQSTVALNSVNLQPAEDQFVNYQFMLDRVDAEMDLLAFFVLLSLLRTLKFLTIPPYTGAPTQSILQTMSDRAFIVFVGMFSFVLLTFCLSFYILLGVQVEELSDYGQSLTTVIRLIFGDFEYDIFENKYISGPALFVFFMLFVGLVLMNLFIAVISDTYINIVTQNATVYEIYINSLLIKTIEKNGKIITWKGVRKVIAWIKKKILRRRPQQTRPANNVNLVSVNGAAKTSLESIDFEDDEDLEADEDDNADEEDYDRQSMEAKIVYDEDSLDKLAVQLQTEKKAKEPFAQTERLSTEVQQLRSEIAQIKDLLSKLVEKK